jgi:hypothetical protein
LLWLRVSTRVPASFRKGVDTRAIDGYSVHDTSNMDWPVGLTEGLGGEGARSTSSSGAGGWL